MPQIRFSSEFSVFSEKNVSGLSSLTLTGENGRYIFSNTYNPGAEGITVYGLDKIIESDLRQNNRTYGQYVIKTISPKANKQTVHEYTIIHCRRQMPLSAKEWLKTNFLLESGHYDIPEGYDSPLPIYFWLEDTEAAAIKSWYKDSDGRLRTESGSIIFNPGMNSLDMSAAGLKAPVHTSLTIGSRRISFSLIPKPSTINPQPSSLNLIQFRNTYNTDELLTIKGITARTPAADSQTAFISGRSRRIDIRPEDSFTLTVSDITQQQAEAIARLMHSHQVHLLTLNSLPSTLNYKPSTLNQIIIEDIAGTISDSPSDLCEVKITYRPLLQ